MADVALEALREARIDAGDLALILTGGDTALGVLQLLDYEGIELEGELLEGIVQGTCGADPGTASPLSPRPAPSGRRTPW